MEKEEIKAMFFEYNCNISSLLRDNGNISTNVYNTILSNTDVWVKEFLEENAQIIKEANDFLILAQAFSRYKIASKTYTDLFNLSRLLKSVIIKEKFNIEGLFIYYYELIVVNMELTENESESLFDYLKKYDLNNYQILINDIKEVLEKDNGLFSDYCKNLKSEINNMISK